MFKQKLISSITIAVPLLICIVLFQDLKKSETLSKVTSQSRSLCHSTRVPNFIFKKHFLKTLFVQNSEINVSNPKA